MTETTMATTALTTAQENMTSALETLRAVYRAADDPQTQFTRETHQQRVNDAEAAYSQARHQAATLTGQAQDTAKTLRECVEYADEMSRVASSETFLALARNLAPFTREDCEDLPLVVLADRMRAKTAKGLLHERALLVRYGRRRLESILASERLGDGYAALRDAVTALRATVVDQGPITEADAVDAAAAALGSASAMAMRDHTIMHGTRQMVASGTMRRAS